MNTIERKNLQDKLVIQDQRSLIKLDWPGVRTAAKLRETYGPMPLLRL